VGVTVRKQTGRCTKASRAFVDAKAEHSSTYSAPRLRNIEKHIPNPFTKLDQGKYLHDRPEKDVYKRLIDSFRMRQADNLNLENKTTPRSIYSGTSSSIEPFREYLAKAATRPNMLPPWWDADKQEECEAFGESGAWSDLRHRTSKQEIIDYYGDDKMPMQVRMLAEAVYGVGSMGQNGAGIRKMMAQMESGGPGGGMHMSSMRLA
jgi:splicing suppressor protein 51